MPTYAYVTISEEDKILIFTLDTQSGKLDLQKEVAVSGRPAPLATDPEKKFLFVGRRDIDQISSYRIDQTTGDISEISSTQLQADPCFLATDRKGKFLFSSYYEGSAAAVHSISDNGMLSSEPVVWRETAKGSHSMQADPSNRFAFVPHISGGNGPNAIFQFKFDENTGQLTPNSPPRVEPSEELGPRHFCFHPSKDILYFSNEQGCSITAYNLNTETGTLSAFQTITTLPEDYEGSNSCAQIQISPNGRFLYAPNRGHNSIARFNIDESDGGLTATGHTASEPVPRAVSLDPQGNFFFAAGLDSGRVASYKVNQDNGDLEPLEIYTVGKAPMWILITEVES